jgi:hypothetical protein
MQRPDKSYQVKNTQIDASMSMDLALLCRKNRLSIAACLLT